MDEVSCGEPARSQHLAGRVILLEVAGEDTRPSNQQLPLRLAIEHLTGHRIGDGDLDVGVRLSR